MEHYWISNIPLFYIYANLQYLPAHITWCSSEEKQGANKINELINNETLDIHVQPWHWTVGPKSLFSFKLSLDQCQECPEDPSWDTEEVVRVMDQHAAWPEAVWKLQANPWAQLLYEKSFKCWLVPSWQTVHCTNTAKSNPNVTICHSRQA